jgi:glycosyltransferase involved in cell wall biosynthesis
MISRQGSNLAFLIGQPRSGTTLLSLVLSKAPEIRCPPEPWVALPITRLLRDLPDVHAEDSDETLAHLAMSQLLDEDERSELVSRLLVATYNRLLARAEGARLFVDKTPRYYKIIATLARLLPRARFVLLARHPLDVAASHKSRWKLDLRGLTTASGLRDSSFDVFCAPALIADARDELGSRAHWLRYEELVARPAEIVSELCDFLGVPFREELLAYARKNPAGREYRRSTLGDDQVWSRSRIDEHSVGRWKHILDDGEVALVCSTLGAETFERLGYECPRPARTRSKRASFLRDALAAEVRGGAQLGTGSRARLRTLQANLARLRELASRAEQSAVVEREARGAEASARGRLERLLEQTEQHLGRVSALLAEAEAQRGREAELRANQERETERWHELARGAEEGVAVERRARDEEARAKEFSQDLLAQTEVQRERLWKLLSEAEEQRDRIRTLLTATEQQRDHERELRARSEELVAGANREREAIEARLDLELRGRQQWEALCREAETRRDALEARTRVLESERTRLRTLWPWLETTADAAGGSVPRISVVTPSLNQARWIEAAIRSVLDQAHPEFEHIVVDGGSTDATAEIVARHPHVRFVHEPDLGQAHAINKGMLLATGDIVAFLNADDLYRPGAFAAVAKALSDPDGPRAVVGGCDYVDEDGDLSGHLVPRLDRYWDLLRYWGWDRWYCIPQQAVFWRRDLLSETGLFDVGLHFTMDYEMWLRMAARTRFAILPQTLAAFRLQAESKTVSRTHAMYLEERASSRRYWPAWWRPSRWYLELASLRHLAGKLLDVAEHEALSNARRSHPLRLLLQGVRRWPLLLANPRTALTALSAVCAKSPFARASARLHRAYLRGLWLTRRRFGRRRELLSETG